MSAPTINAEVFARCSGPKSVPLTAQEISNTIAIAGVAFDFSGEAFNAARKQWPKLPSSTAENSALESWLVTFGKHPEAVLYVMNETVKYMRGRNPITKALAVKHLTQKTHIEIALDTDPKCKLDKRTKSVKRASNRLNAAMRDYERAVGPSHITWREGDKKH
jgi:hypothetical protein